MASVSVVCCTELEVKYRKRGGGIKCVNDTAVPVSEVDTYLNELMKKTNFKELISVRMIRIHTRPLRSAEDSDSDSDTEEEEEVEDEHVEAQDTPNVLTPSQ